MIGLLYSKPDRAPSETFRISGLGLRFLWSPRHLPSESSWGLLGLRETFRVSGVGLRL